MWDKITCPFPNFNGCTVEVWEWISNFIPHFTRHVITYHWSLGMDKWLHLTFYQICNYLSMPGLKLNHVSKKGPPFYLCLQEACDRGGVADLRCRGVLAGCIWRGKLFGYWIFCQTGSLLFRWYIVTADDLVPFSILPLSGKVLYVDFGHNGVVLCMSLP